MIKFSFWFPKVKAKIISIFVENFFIWMRVYIQILNVFRVGTRSRPRSKLQHMLESTLGRFQILLPPRHNTSNPLPLPRRLLLCVLHQPRRINNRKISNLAINNIIHATLHWPNDDNRGSFWHVDPLPVHARYCTYVQIQEKRTSTAYIIL